MKKNCRLWKIKWCIEKYKFVKICKKHKIEHTENGSK